MSTAVVFEKTGSPDVLHTMEIPTPEPKRGQVLVRVRAAGVQPYDTKVRQGAYPVEMPYIAGGEFAGIIAGLGEGVVGWSEGDEVIGFGSETHASHVVVGVDQIAVKPSDMPWPEAGALTASGQTALTVLKDLGVRKGDTILIHAAAGGVGSYAVQIAKAWGATVIGSASQRNHEYLRLLGAIPVTYGDGLPDRVRVIAPHGVDVALDAFGGDAVAQSLELVSDPRRVGSIANFGADKLGARVLGTRRSAGQITELTDLYEQGLLRVEIAGVFPLDQAAAAHSEVETGHVRGKVVLIND